MSKGKRVTLPETTMNGLAKFAKPFESPEDCISRMINCGCVQNEMEKQNKEPIEDESDEE